MSQWREVLLEDLADELTVGYVGPMASEYVPSGIPFLRSQNVEPLRVIQDDIKFITPEFHKRIIKSALSPGDVVIVRTGKPGACTVMPDSLPVANCSDLVIVRCGKKLDARFLAYYVNTVAADHVSAHLVGAVQQHFNVGSARKLKMLLPELGEQRAIAAVLGALDDKIELNRRMNETLEALAQSLFKSWFVPACRSLGAGRDATLPASRGQAGQSALPKGWREATISELCEINSWTLGKGDELDRIEYVEISEVMRGNIANIQSYERGEEPSRARRRLRHGDTVLSTVRPDRGAYFLCLNPSPNLIGSTGFAVLTPTKAPWSFIHAAMTQPDVFEYLGQQADGGAYPAVRPEIIGGLEVPWPNKPELVKDFHRACAPLYERAELNRQESRTLAALRDALLPKLLSGELRLPSQMLRQAGVPGAAGKPAEATA